MKQKNNKIQVAIFAANLAICFAFLCISITRVNANKWNSCWIWIWGLLSLLNIVFLVFKAKDLKNKE
jgi:hypothetical protein